jgi:hypothetical protein
MIQLYRADEELDMSVFNVKRENFACVFFIACKDQVGQTMRQKQQTQMVVMRQMSPRLH